MYVPALPRVMN